MKNLNKKLNIEDELEDKIQEEIIITPEECEFSENINDDVVEDYKFIRRKLRYAIAASETVFDFALRDMASNPSARGVEGCAIILKTITECTNQLLTTHDKIKKIKNIQEIKPDMNDSEKDEAGKTNIKATINDIISSFDEK